MSYKKIALYITTMVVYAFVLIHLFIFGAIYTVQTSWKKDKMIQILACSLPAKSLSGVRKSMQWHSFLPGKYNKLEDD